MNGEQIEYKKLNADNNFTAEEKAELQQIKESTERSKETKDNLHKLSDYILSEVRTTSIKELNKIPFNQLLEWKDFLEKNKPDVAKNLNTWIGKRDINRPYFKPFLATALAQSMMIACCDLENNLKGGLFNDKKLSSRAVDGAYGLNTFSTIKTLLGEQFDGVLNQDILEKLFQHLGGSSLRPEVEKQENKEPIIASINEDSHKTDVSLSENTEKSENQEISKNVVQENISVTEYTPLVEDDLQKKPVSEIVVIASNLTERLESETNSEIIDKIQSDRSLALKVIIDKQENFVNAQLKKEFALENITDAEKIIDKAKVLGGEKWYDLVDKAIRANDKNYIWTDLRKAGGLDEKTKVLIEYIQKKEYLTVPVIADAAIEEGIEQRYAKAKVEYPQDMPGALKTIFEQQMNLFSLNPRLAHYSLQLANSVPGKETIVKDGKGTIINAVSLRDDLNSTNKNQIELHFSMIDGQAADYVCSIVKSDTQEGKLFTITSKSTEVLNKNTVDQQNLPKTKEEKKENKSLEKKEKKELSIDEQITTFLGIKNKITSKEKNGKILSLTVPKELFGEEGKTTMDSISLFLKQAPFKISSFKNNPILKQNYDKKNRFDSWSFRTDIDAVKTYAEYLKAFEKITSSIQKQKLTGDIKKGGYIFKVESNGTLTSIVDREFVGSNKPVYSLEGDKITLTQDIFDASKALE